MTPIKTTVIAAMAAVGFMLSSAKQTLAKKPALTMRNRTIAVLMAKFLLLTSITPYILLYVYGFDLMLSFGTVCSESRQQDWLV